MQPLGNVLFARNDPRKQGFTLIDPRLPSKRLGASREDDIMVQGFTLIELLVVIAILAVLAVVVVLVLNPAALLAEARDANRLSDMATINNSVNAFSAEAPTAAALGSANTVYVSVPDLIATSSAGDQCQGLGLPSLSGTGFSYHCAASSTNQKVDGTGWMPINFSSASFGAPISLLPTDPLNTTSTDFYYTYVASGGKWQLTSQFEAQKNTAAKANSGNSDPALYTIGSNLSLAPFVGGMIAWWPFDEGNGTIANDYSGFNNVATLNGGVPWTTGKTGSAVYFTASTTYITVSSTLFMGSSWTVMTWVKTTSTFEMPIITNRLTGGNLYYGTTGGKVFNYGPCNTLNPLPLITDGNFHFIAMTENPSAESWYVDGVFAGTTSSCTSGQNAKIDFGAGDGNVNEYFNGAVDDVRIYNRVLSASEIQAIYTAGK